MLADAELREMSVCRFASYDSDNDTPSDRWQIRKKPRQLDAVKTTGRRISSEKYLCMRILN